MGVCSAVYEHIVFFLNIKLFIFYYSGHFQRPLFVVIDAVCEKLAYLDNTQYLWRGRFHGFLTHRLCPGFPLELNARVSLEFIKNVISKESS